LDKAAGMKYAEAFDLCEYGAQPDKAELKRLVPFFGEQSVSRAGREVRCEPETVDQGSVRSN